MLFFIIFYSDKFWQIPVSFHGVESGLVHHTFLQHDILMA